MDQLAATTGGAPAAAVELRRALYALEAAWHPSWRPADAACSLPLPACPPSAGGVGSSSNFDVLRGGRGGRRGSEAAGALAADMYGAVHRYARHASRTAAPRAALELAKLGLAMGLPPVPPPGPQQHVAAGEAGAGSDPCRALLLVGDLALRARQGEWLLELTGGGGGTGAGGGLLLGSSDVPCVMLPGLALARALALLQREEQMQRLAAPPPTAAAAAAAAGGVAAADGTGGAAGPSSSSSPLPRVYADASAWASLPARAFLARTLLQVRDWGRGGGGRHAACLCATPLPPSPHSCSLQFPHVLRPLVDACGLLGAQGQAQGRPTPAALRGGGIGGGVPVAAGAGAGAWGPLLEHPLFSGAPLVPSWGEAGCGAAALGPCRPPWPAPPALAKLESVAVCRLAQVSRVSGFGSLGIATLPSRGNCAPHCCRCGARRPRPVVGQSSPC